MQVVWSNEALTHLSEIQEHIEKDKPEIAARVAARIIEQTARLGLFPELGRPIRGPGRRRLIISGTPFIVAYRVEVDRVTYSGSVMGLGDVHKVDNENAPAAGSPL